MNRQTVYLSFDQSIHPILSYPDEGSLAGVDEGVDLLGVFHQGELTPGHQQNVEAKQKHVDAE